MKRRNFLHGVLSGVAAVVLRPGRLFAITSVTGAAANSSSSAAVSASASAVSTAGATGFFLPEYAGSLDEFLFVYDQCAAPHLLREMVEIVRHAPTRASIHVLVSRGLAETARARMAEFGLEDAEILISDEEGVSGDWGRDIFQLGVERGGGGVVEIGGQGNQGGVEGSVESSAECEIDNLRTLGVPWFKGAAKREDLDRGWRKLRALEREDLGVRLIPVAFEGGNLMTDVLGGRNILFAGSTIAVETRALYKIYYGTDPGDEGVARILAEGLGADRVVWMGPRRGGQLARQSRYGFHIDMGMTLVAPQVAVVARCDPLRLAEDEHREILRREAARTLEALARREAMGVAWPEDLELPREEVEREAFLDRALTEERRSIQDAAAEWESMARQLIELEYTVHRIEANPRRVRRFQSHTNAIVTAERLLAPIFPSEEHVHGWLLRTDNGRDRIDVELGLSDSEFALEGDNLAAIELYRRLHPEVRVVRDYFYLASGNVHCVVGRMT